jgi:NAD+ kinase
VSDDDERRVFLLVNTRREKAVEVAQQFCTALTSSSIVVRMLAEDAAEVRPAEAGDPCVEVVEQSEQASAGCELVLVIGGDGTILRAAEFARESGTPLLGVNLGHVGFLAEAEQEDVEHTIDAIIARRYEAEERLTIDVAVYRGNQVVASTWALNEASVEKAARERMIEVVVEVDGRPLSRWGCDGVVCSTPTGSTAYNFSAGGPIVWPQVQALLLVPLSAHALFARPMVVAPTSVLAVEVIADTEGMGVLWCDGRRTVDLPPGARIEVRRGHAPIRLARLHLAPFTDRLVAKFELPVSGWRGGAERRRVGREKRSESQRDDLPGGGG